MGGVSILKVLLIPFVVVVYFSSLFFQRDFEKQTLVEEELLIHHKDLTKSSPFAFSASDFV